MLALGELMALAEARGADPYIRLPHSNGGGRSALRLDLVEPFRRSLVDRLTLRPVISAVLPQDDFDTWATPSRRPLVGLQPEPLRRGRAGGRVPRQPDEHSLPEGTARQVGWLYRGRWRRARRRRRSARPDGVLCRELEVLDERRRRRAMEALKECGWRMQGSAFECGLDRAGHQEYGRAAPQRVR